MATTTHITIPYPVLPTSPAGHFDVVITADATGSIVYTGTPTNVLFDVTLATGCYTMSTTYGDYSNQWCFCVSDCSCIPYVSSVMTLPSTPGVYYAEITFDIAGWDFCPFAIKIHSDIVGDPVYIINSLLDFTHISGTLYKYTAFVGNSPTAIITIYKGVDSVSGVCVVENVAYSCLPAQIVDPLHPTSFFIEFIKISSDWFIRFHFWTCGTSCHYFTVNYQQNYWAPTTGDRDTGSTVITLNCSDPSPWQYDLPIHPGHTFYAGQGGLDISALTHLAYFMQITDCCGNPITYITGIHNYPIPGFGPG